MGDRGGSLSRRAGRDARAAPGPGRRPGQADVSAPDGPQGQPNAGFLWDAALRANLTVRNYGFYVDTTRYTFPQTSAYSSMPTGRTPARSMPYFMSYSWRT